MASTSGEPDLGGHCHVCPGPTGGDEATQLIDVVACVGLTAGTDHGHHRVHIVERVPRRVGLR